MLNEDRGSMKKHDKEKQQSAIREEKRTKPLKTARPHRAGTYLEDRRPEHYAG